MPFSQFAAFYDPETLAVLRQAFDDAWPIFQGSLRLDDQAARELLAARIIQAHSEGEREAGALTAAALKGLRSN